MSGYIGSEPIDRASETTFGYTYIDRNVPATKSGMLYQVQYYGSTNGGTKAAKVKIFRSNGANWDYIGGQSITGANGLQVVTISPMIAILAGDFIAWWTDNTSNKQDIDMAAAGAGSRKTGDITGNSAKSGWTDDAYTLSLKGYVLGGGGWSGVSMGNAIF